MKTKTTLTTLSIFSVLLAALTVQAVPDRDLHINGHFRGTPQGYSPAPGWTLTPDGGNARILPGFKPGKFRLEIIASPHRAQSRARRPADAPPALFRRGPRKVEESAPLTTR